MAIDIAFFKAKHGQLDDKLIDFFSGRIGYSHCEFVVDPYNTIGSHALTNGVARFKYNNIYNNPAWDIIRVPEADYKKALEYAEVHIGDSYDFLGVALHYIGIDIYEERDGQWCSEFCDNCIAASVDRSKWQTSLPMPNELFVHMLNKLGSYKVQNLDAGNKPTYAKLPIDYLGRIGYGAQ